MAEQYSNYLLITIDFKAGMIAILMPILRHKKTKQKTMTNLIKETN